MVASGGMLFGIRKPNGSPSPLNGRLQKRSGGACSERYPGLRDVSSAAIRLRRLELKQTGRRCLSWMGSGV